MPRHPEGRVAMSDAERQARRRVRKQGLEQRRLETLKFIANDHRVPIAIRELARAALEGKPQ